MRVATTQFCPSAIQTAPGRSQAPGAGQGGIRYYVLLPDGVLSIYGKPWERFNAETEFLQCCAQFARWGYVVRAIGSHFATVALRTPASVIVTRMGEDKQRAGFVAQR